MKHTPGPWGYEYSEANNAYEIAPYPIDGALDWSRQVCITADNNEANAVLIASAPALLKALRQIVEMNPELPMGMIEYAQEVVKKITGEPI